MLNDSPVSCERSVGPGFRVACSVLTACCLIGLGAPGCHDPRISIYDFIEMQRTMMPASSRQPKVPVTEIWTRRAFVAERVGPKDELSVELTGLNGDPTETHAFRVRVDRNGQIKLPEVGKVTVTNLELEDADEVIHDRFVPRIVKQIVVKTGILKAHTTDVLVKGAVATPGLVPLRRTELNLLYAVANAGGVSSLASGRVSLKRLDEPETELTLNLHNPADLKTAFAIAPLESGDIVTVEAAPPNTIFVGGLVNAPGVQPYPPGTQVSLRQSLVAAGGVQDELYPSEATLIRRMSDGKDVQVRIDLERLRNGEDPDILLAAGDVFWVPHTFGTRTMDFINRNIFFRAGFTASYNVVGNASGIEFLNRRALQSTGVSGTTRGGGTTLQNRVDPLGFLAR